MPRITISVDDDQDEWLDELAERLDRSKSWVASECIEEMRAGESYISEYQNANRSDADDIGGRVADLESKMERIEEILTSEPPDRGSSSSIESMHADAHRPPDDDQDSAPGPDTDPDPGTEPDDDAPPTDIEAALEGWRPGMRGDDRDRRRAVGREAVKWLREQGDATRREFVDALYDELVIEGAGEDSWWRRTVRPALNECRDAGLAKFAEGHKVWRWDGNES